MYCPMDLDPVRRRGRRKKGTTAPGQDPLFMADSSLASRSDAEAQARRVARSNAVV
jgi:hypothetical protein